MKPVLTNGKVVLYDYKSLTLLNRDQILELLDYLMDRINKSFVMMGGILWLIRKNKWFKPHSNLMNFSEDIGIPYRKVLHLIQIYESLINNHIPFEDISEIGFTRAVLISNHLTEANAAEMIEWAGKLSTLQIEEELKAAADKSKVFLAKVAANAVLQPDYTEKSKTVKHTPTVLRNLITTTPIEMILNALKVIYPDKDFVLA